MSAGELTEEDEAIESIRRFLLGDGEGEAVVESDWEMCRERLIGGVKYLDVDAGSLSDMENRVFEACQMNICLHNRIHFA